MLVLPKSIVGCFVDDHLQMSITRFIGAAIIIVDLNRRI